MEDKYLFSLLEDPSWYDGVNTFIVDERNFYTEEEIKNKEYVVGNGHYPIYTLEELPKVMKEHPKYSFYDTLLRTVDDEWKQKIIDSGIEIKNGA